ncbi:V-type H+-transporting ATPase subunit H [Marchantia polymorpha subsp. ruderalis]|uniref:V-type proton ATPase subunit H n=2 Tax=Marchantia polymorpha TaxID=3197 RepID=A0A176WBA2_MARPO|nr:hypothetical protein AXG93_4201s1610 [Marchantia polymorpha subsp. ruderalis]PTQ32123.1 hypothetical protein MARPO_0102s0002 [Marchantia polymorpha]BBN17967.1 hypothetical protein Mp_7g18380 [Marchantia polymorpha subsp. ruderalis]|eukprot:PTQ32123.1 hypothetical protein MARPO_0102s0002 [Marchantia polymorpha]
MASEPEVSKETVLKRDIPWETYMTAKLITSTGLQLLRRYDHRPDNVQAALLDENGVAYVRVFVGILRDITKEETVEYMLAVIDDMLSANPKRARLFHDKALSGDDVYGPFLRLLSKRKWFIQETSCKILTLIISARPSEEISMYEENGSSSSSSNGAQKQPSDDFDKTLAGVVEWLCVQLKSPSHPTRAIPTAVSALAILFREAKVRALFVEAGGVKSLVPLISPASTQQYIQLLYEATLSVWLLTFYERATEAMAETKIIHQLVEVVKVSTKEKVVRVALLSLRNLVKKGNFAAELVGLGMPKIIQNLRLQAWSDEDLNAALDELESTLKDSAKELNSFDRYKQEVFSGNLDWTPMHKDQSFWRENIKRFEDDDYQVLRILITILETSRDGKTLAVACSDISQFIQNHPTGRGIVSDLKAKDRVMRLMAHEKPDVAREALLCVQKILLSPKYVSYMQ